MFQIAPDCVSVIHVRSESGDDYYLSVDGDASVGTRAREAMDAAFKDTDDEDSVYIMHVEVVKCP